MPRPALTSKPHERPTALLGRAGWTVEWDVDSAGSYDEMPANILSYGRRDRRWCQGNFQHFWLIFGDGVRFGHRRYFANGILAYTDRRFPRWSRA